MNECVSPEGHDWEAVSFQSSAGSTPVACTREGCDEIGYRIDNRVLAQNPGQPGEELF